MKQYQSRYINSFLHSRKDAYSCASQQSALDQVASSHCDAHFALFEAWRGRDLQQALLEVWVVVFSDGVELFDVIFFEDFSHHILAVNDHLQISVLVLCLEGEFLAASDAISHFQ